MKKKKRETTNKKIRGFLKIKFFYKVIDFIILLFIFIGDIVLNLVFIPLRLLFILLFYGLIYFGFIIQRGHLFYSQIKKWILKNLKQAIWRGLSHILKLKLLVHLLVKKKKKVKKSLYNFSKRNKITLFKFSAVKFKYFVLGIAFAAMLTTTYQSYLFVKSLPDPRLIGSVNFPLSTHILDRNGKLLYEIYREQNRTPVQLDDLPKYIAQATIAIEDKDFYKHKGVSFISGIIRAVKENILHGGLQGGSTITQQLVKSALLTPEKTIQRKVKEIILALWAEKLFTKKQILEMYLNQVPYGGSAYGIEEGARTYFGKHAKELTLDEAALLAGLPQAPSLYSPYSDPISAKIRRDEVLKHMFQQGYITDKQSKEYSNKVLAVNSPKTTIKAPHFVFYVRQRLEEEYGVRKVEEGGLRVYTTLDLDIQTEAEKILKDELDKIKNLNVTNGAILVTRPPTGEILAMVGSVDYFATPSGAFNVTTALRQPGSAIKPIMYSLALDRGYTAATIIDDTPAVFGIPGSELYRPVNYDGRFHGKIPLRFALANSYNIPAVKVLNSIGVSSFVEFAKKMGINTWNDSSRFGLSLTLGGGEVNMIDMSTAYGVLANNGYKIETESIINLQDVQGKSLYKSKPRQTEVIGQGNTFIISDILSDNSARQAAFGPRSFLEIPGYKIAVKTGTTDSKKDNWTIGYTPEFLVTVWVGNNNGTPMHPYLTSGITGASPIWNRVMGYVLKTNSLSTAWYSKPEDVIEKECYVGKKEFFVKGTDSLFCNSKKILESSKPTVKPNTYN